MNARQLIEAEDPKSIFKQIRNIRRYQPRRLTPREQERLVNILAYGPIEKEDIDDRFLDWGYIEYYDNDQRDAVDAKPGFGAAFYSHPEIKGAIGREWLDIPTVGKGWAPRKYYWREAAEDPKRFLKSLTPRKMAEVRSSHGTFTIDRETGRVMQWQPEDPMDPDAQALKKIKTFDLNEWRKHWKWEGELPYGFDVLDLGFWLADGMYEPPDDDWREQTQELADGRVANPE